MNISSKEIIRTEAHAKQIHFQYADRDSQAEGIKSYRTRYFQRMAEHGYELSTEDEPAFIEYVRTAWARARVFVGFLRSEG